VVEKLQEKISGYTILEVDQATGERQNRETGIVELLKRVTGAEAATVVNNNAAAVLLSVSVMAEGGEVIVSRGELVEIGGGFRIPDVLACSGAELREVGSTNRTTIRDYEEAVTEGTRLLMRIHASNFKVVGEMESPTREEIVALGRRLSIPVVEDLGSGLVDHFGFAFLEEEPAVRDAVAQGVDLVTFSGDKLLGGPQSGIILGRDSAVREIRANPLFRAVRPDKMTLAVLEEVLACYEDPDKGHLALPFFAALDRTREERRAEARRLAAALGEVVPEGKFTVEPSQAFAGSGSLPVSAIPSFSVKVRLPGRKPSELARSLRLQTTPVFTTVRGDGVFIDVMTLFPEDTERLCQVFSKLAKGE